MEEDRDNILNNNAERPFPSPDEIPNWKEVLNERYSPRRVFVVPKEPKAASDMVSQAVFKTLTGRDLIEHERELLGGGAPTEKLELQLLNMMEDNRLDREKGGFSKEAEEALIQGREAGSANLDDWQPWSKHYDYWDGVVRIGQTLRLGKPRSGGDYLLLSAPVAEMGENVGFPEVLVNKKWEMKQRDLERNPERTPETEMLKILEGLGFDRDEVRQDILDSEITNQFFDTIGYDRVNEILAQNGKPNTKTNWNSFYERRKELMPIVFEGLEEEEKNKVTAERTTGILNSLSREIDKDGHKARVSINVQMEGANVKYNPQTKHMEGDLSQGRWYHLSYEVQPEVTPDTRHDALLAIREEGLEIANKAGL
jgi:hypothetical protein